MPSVPALTLNNGVEIPQLGFGTFQIPPEDTRETTLAALKAGYRHIDTAQMYGNEKEVGQAVLDSGLDRADVFVTSKLDNGAHAYDDALQAFEGTMEKVRLDYLDLFLIHWPLPDRATSSRPGRRWRRSTARAASRRSGSPTSSRTTCAACWTAVWWCPPSTRSRYTRISPRTP